MLRIRKKESRVPMEKQKKWHRNLIICVIALTIYNILPTVFYYTKPLKSPIDKGRAESVAKGIVNRVNSLESQSINWVKSYAKLLGTKTKSINLDKANPQMIHVEFKDQEDTKSFAHSFPRAGSLIPFAPAQLALSDEGEKSVTISRSIPIHMDGKLPEKYFTFGTIGDELYHEVVGDRLVKLGETLGGVSENAHLVQGALSGPQGEEYLIYIAQNINTYADVFSKKPRLADPFYATFSQGGNASIDNLIGALDHLKDQTKLARIALEKESEGKLLGSAKAGELEMLKSRETQLGKAAQIVRKNPTAFRSGKAPWTHGELEKLVADADGSLNLSGRSPLIDTVSVLWDKGQIQLSLKKDLAQFRDSLGQGYERDEIDKLIYREVARLSRESGEDIVPVADHFNIALNQLTDAKSFLTMNLGEIAKSKTDNLITLLHDQWKPEHRDLQVPIWNYETYKTLSEKQKRLGLLVYSPSMTQGEVPAGLKKSSIYVIAKGLDQVRAKVGAHPESDEAMTFQKDFEKLAKLMKENGLIGYRGSSYPFGVEFAKDFLFEEEDYYQAVLAATRENFKAFGTKQYAILDFTNVEQRILATNKIEDGIHEDLLKWRDEYQAAQVNPNLDASLEVPKPTSSPLLSNWALSARKYFRGDERKVLRWGLDLSGGKTVQIELRDRHNRIVKNEADLNQGINELYRRVNKMGVSEVSIRQEGSNITLDFPGSQGLSATDLVKASTMSFHVVNEKFSVMNKDMREAVNTFLQDVWNEAVVTNQKDVESVNAIAWRHLYGEGANEITTSLVKAGLKLAEPNQSYASSSFNDEMSKIALYRGDSFTEWQGQTHPLLVVFSNYVMEGSNLENIRAGYDQTKGNYLSFDVASKQTLSDGSVVTPREDLRTWTGVFSKDKVTQSGMGVYSNNRGYRMAVILNGSVISSPTLDSVLDRSAMISGSFTQREINKLEADLKAGSLSFAPQILSEKNVSPELGLKDRVKGIVATIVALACVIGLMCGYYRFAGFIASIAVLINLLIMWATLQNIQATMTLAGIAAIILTMGMAVDANVLVFERIREEFAASGRIASAVRAGYKKAFTAILDSNVTTVIAAIILLNFDSGPIKGFAVTLIIGIATSMFTALFMTRYFFMGWVQNPNNKELKMANLIKGANFNFLRYGKMAIGASLAVILVGGYLLTANKSSILGMDFSGGFALTVDVKPNEAGDYRNQVEKALEKAGLTSQEFQVRELSPSNSLKLLLSTNLDQDGKAFAGMPLDLNLSDAEYGYENNPRITWVVHALEQSGLGLTTASLENLESNWANVSGQMSSAMRSEALIGLGFALLCILIYISIRFEFKYALCATLGLAFDISFTMGFLGLLHLAGVPVQIDLKIVAALMTIIGYSLNDTIIIFDRIRENVRFMRKASFTDVINNALNVTLSRTVMTSSTTLIVLLALIALGGSTIFGLALVMIIGVIYGTLSSLFVAAPMLHMLSDTDEARALKVANVH